MRKQAYINGCAALAIAAAAGWAGLAQAVEIDSWNRDNVVTDLPPHEVGVTYDSKLFTGVPRLESNGAVIWKEGSVVSPGAQVLTDSPEGSGRNCIITTGVNRANPTQPKTCTDEFQSAKRVKLDARAAGTGTIIPDPNGEIDLLDGKPLDMVFNVTALDGDWRTYRVFKKYINATVERTDAFVVELGFGTGDVFQPSTDGDGLKFSPGARGQNPNPPDFGPLPVESDPPGDSDLGSLMSAGLFGDADAISNRTVDGYFGLPDDVVPWPDPSCDPDPSPSNTGRSYYDLVVRTEDRIETAGVVQGLHYCLFGNMLPQGQLPLGYFWDDDGDAATDADTIADWDGSGDSPACGGTACWETYVVLDTDPTSENFGDPVLVDGNFIRPPKPPVAVPQEVIDFWVDNPEVTDPADPEFGRQFYFIAALDDMGLVNNNYHITVESIEDWPTYDTATGTATFTMRTSNLGEGVPFVAPWLSMLPPELEPAPPESDVSVSAFTVDGQTSDLEPVAVTEGTVVPVAVTVTTAANRPAASGSVVGEATDADGKLIASFFGVFTDVAAGTSQILSFDWEVADPTGLPASATWNVMAFVDGGDGNLGDNTASVKVAIAAAPPAPEVDVAIKKLEVDDRVRVSEREEVEVYVFNFGPNPASGTVSVVGTDSDGDQVATFSDQFTNLAPNRKVEFEWDWTAPSKPTTIDWLATVTAAGDTNLENNTATATTEVVKRKGRYGHDDD